MIIWFCMLRGSSRNIFEKIKNLEIYVVTNVLLPGILPGIISSFCQMANQTKFKKGNSKFHRIGSFFKKARNKNAFFVTSVASSVNWDWIILSWWCCIFDLQRRNSSCLWWSWSSPRLPSIFDCLFKISVITSWNLLLMKWLV